jgi:hypothetical protein
LCKISKTKHSENFFSKEMNFFVRKFNFKAELLQGETRPAWAGFKTAEEGRTKIM